MDCGRKFGSRSVFKNIRRVRFSAALYYSALRRFLRRGAFCARSAAARGRLALDKHATVAERKKNGFATRALKAFKSAMNISVLRCLPSANKTNFNNNYI